MPRRGKNGKPLPAAPDRGAVVAVLRDDKAAYIEKLVSEAPPLTASQRDRLASLLRPTGDGSDADVA